MYASLHIRFANCEGSCNFLKSDSSICPCSTYLLLSLTVYFFYKKGGYGADFGLDMDRSFVVDLERKWCSLCIVLLRTLIGHWRSPRVDPVWSHSADGAATDQVVSRLDLEWSHSGICRIRAVPLSSGAGHGLEGMWCSSGDTMVPAQCWQGLSVESAFTSSLALEKSQKETGSPRQEIASRPRSECIVRCAGGVGEEAKWSWCGQQYAEGSHITWHRLHRTCHGRSRAAQ